MQQYKKHFVILLFIASFLVGCKKLVQVGEPVNTITTTEAFNSDANATSAVMRIYNDMIVGFGGGPFSYANSYTTMLAGLSADELQYNGAGEILQFQNNTLQSNNTVFYNPVWVEAYKEIYVANASIEGLQNSTSLSTATKDQLLGETKFLRAFIHFYLVNLFGDIPMLTSTHWASASTMTRTPKAEVYQQIVTDLKDAQALLKDGYAVSNGLRIRANRAAATALLARVYLYLGDWSNAEASASAVINGGNYSMETNLSNVFLKNSNEAIWQLEIANNRNPYATIEGNKFIPEYLTTDFDSATVAAYWQYFLPQYYLTNSLLNAFESSDQRKTKWTDSTKWKLNGVEYYYPKKYKVRVGSSGNVNEYYMVLRLAEQYLIRAEARAKKSNPDLSGAISDLNIIRIRAGLSNLSSSLTQTQVLAAIAQENRIEFFTEWGHRWFDLKRTGQADVVLSPIKGSNWQTTDQLWPIPLSEIQLNPNLTQNLGY